MRPAVAECLARPSRPLFRQGLLDDIRNWTNGVSTSSNAGPPTRDRDRLSDHDRSIIGPARQLAGLSGPAAVRVYFGNTAVSCADTAPAYAEALGQATRVIGELLAIIERLADGRAWATMDREWGKPLARVGPRTYEITFTGRAGDVLRAAFDDCTVIVGPGTTTLRAQLRDQAALWGLVLRIVGLGLDVVDLHLVAPS
jgi:hypothetical protein